MSRDYVVIATWFGMLLGVAAFWLTLAIWLLGPILNDTVQRANALPAVCSETTNAWDCVALTQQ